MYMHAYVQLTHARKHAYVHIIENNVNFRNRTYSTPHTYMHYIHVYAHACCVRNRCTGDSCVHSTRHSHVL
jgi:hypothetical protein